jgi:hypothetical protein
MQGIRKGKTMTSLLSLPDVFEVGGRAGHGGLTPVQDLWAGW